MAEPYSMASQHRHKAITHWNTLTEKQKGNTIHDYYYFFLIECFKSVIILCLFKLQVW